MTKPSLLPSFLYLFESIAERTLNYLSMSELVPSLDVHDPLTLLERHMYGYLTLYCCMAHGRFPVRVPSLMWCVLYDLGCVLCCVYDLVWNFKTYLRNALDIGQVRLLTTAPIH